MATAPTKTTVTETLIINEGTDTNKPKVAPKPMSAAEWIKRNREHAQNRGKHDAA